MAKMSNTNHPLAMKCFFLTVIVVLVFIWCNPINGTITFTTNTPSISTDGVYRLTAGEEYTFQISLTGEHLPTSTQRGNYSLIDESFITYTDLAQDSRLDVGDVGHYGSIKVNPDQCRVVYAMGGTPTPRPVTFRAQPSPLNWDKMTDVTFATHAFSDLSVSGLVPTTTRSAAFQITPFTADGLFSFAEPDDNDAYYELIETSTGVRFILQGTSLTQVDIECKFHSSSIQHASITTLESRYRKVVDVFGDMDEFTPSPFMEGRYGPDWFDWAQITPADGRWLGDFKPLLSYQGGEGTQFFTGSSTHPWKSTRGGSAGYLTRLMFSGIITNLQVASTTPTTIFKTFSPAPLFTAYTQQVSTVTPRVGFVAQSTNTTLFHPAGQSVSSLQPGETYTLTIAAPKGQGYHFEQCYNVYEVSTDVQPSGLNTPTHGKNIGFFTNMEQDPEQQGHNVSNDTQPATQRFGLYEFTNTSTVTSIPDEPRAVLMCADVPPLRNESNLTRWELRRISQPVDIRENPIEIQITIPTEQDVTQIPKYIEITPYSYEVAGLPSPMVNKDTSFQRFAIPPRQTPKLMVTPFYQEHSPFPSTQSSFAETTPNVVRKTNLFNVQRKFCYDALLLPNNLFTSISPLPFATLGSLGSYTTYSGAASFGQLFSAPLIENDADVSKYCTFPTEYAALTNKTLPFHLIAMSRVPKLNTTGSYAESVDRPIVETFFGLAWGGSKATRMAEYTAFIADYNVVHNTAYTTETFELEFSCVQFVTPSVNPQMCTAFGAMAATDDKSLNNDFPHPQVDMVLFEYHPQGRVEANNDIALPTNYDYAAQSPFGRDSVESHLMFNATQIAAYRDPIDICVFTHEIAQQIQKLKDDKILTTDDVVNIDAQINALQALNKYTQDELQVYRVIHTVLTYNRENYNDQFNIGQNQYTLRYPERYNDPWGKSMVDNVNYTASPQSFAHKIEFYYGLQDIALHPWVPHDGEVGAPEYEGLPRWSPNRLLMGTDNMGLGSISDVVIKVWDKYDPYSVTPQTQDDVVPSVGTMNWATARHWFSKSHHGVRCAAGNTPNRQPLRQFWNLDLTDRDMWSADAWKYPENFSTSATETGIDCVDAAYPNYLNNAKPTEDEQLQFEADATAAVAAGFSTTTGIVNTIANSIAFTKYGLYPPTQVIFYFNTTAVSTQGDNVDDNFDAALNRTTYAPSTQRVQLVLDGCATRFSEQSLVSTDLRFATVNDPSAYLFAAQYPIAKYNGIGPDWDQRKALYTTDIQPFAVHGLFNETQLQNVLYSTSRLGSEIAWPPTPQITIVKTEEPLVWKNEDDEKQQHTVVEFALQLDNLELYNNMECHIAPYTAIIYGEKATIEPEYCRQQVGLVKIFPETSIELTFDKMDTKYVKIDPTAFKVKLLTTAQDVAPFYKAQEALLQNKYGNGLSIEFDITKNVLVITNRNKFYPILVNAAQWEIRGALVQTAAQRSAMWSNTILDSKTMQRTMTFDLPFTYQIIQRNAQWVPTQGIAANAQFEHVGEVKDVTYVADDIITPQITIQYRTCPGSLQATEYNTCPTTPVVRVVIETTQFPANGTLLFNALQQNNYLPNYEEIATTYPNVDLKNSTQVAELLTADYQRDIVYTRRSAQSSTTASTYRFMINSATSNTELIHSRFYISRGVKYTLQWDTGLNTFKDSLNEEKEVEVLLLSLFLQPTPTDGKVYEPFNFVANDNESVLDVVNASFTKRYLLGVVRRATDEYQVDFDFARDFAEITYSSLPPEELTNVLFVAIPYKVSRELVEKDVYFEGLDLNSLDLTNAAYTQPFTIPAVCMNYDPSQQDYTFEVQDRCATSPLVGMTDMTLLDQALLDMTHGTCNLSTGACNCSPSFEGEFCEKTQCSTCNSTTTAKCVLRKNAENVNSTGAAVQCTATFSGKFDYCENGQPCCEQITTSKCANGGIISPVIQLDAAVCPAEPSKIKRMDCECPTPWGGKDCKQCNLFCSGNGAGHTGCTTCGCLAGYAGSSCECNGSLLILTFTNIPTPTPSNLINYIIDGSDIYDSTKFKSFNATLARELASFTKTDVNTFTVTKITNDNNQLSITVKAVYGCGAALKPSSKAYNIGHVVQQDDVPFQTRLALLARLLEQDFTQFTFIENYILPPITDDNRSQYYNEDGTPRSVVQAVATDTPHEAPSGWNPGDNNAATSAQYCVVVVAMIIASSMMLLLF